MYLLLHYYIHLLIFYTSPVSSFKFFIALFFGVIICKVVRLKYEKVK
jgi:hypothetical protein